MNLPSGTVGVNIPDSDYSVEVNPEDGTVRVWDGGNGTTYDIAELAGFTDE